MKPLVINYPTERQYNLNMALDNLLPTYFKERLGGGPKQGGWRTDFNLHEQHVMALDELVSWIESILPKVGAYFSRAKEEESCNFNPDAFKITHMWGIRYNKGDCVTPHNHFPLTLSMAYYILTPKGCSPIKIEGKKIKVRAGQCVFFLGSDWHSIDPEPIGGRTLIAANIGYRP